MKIGLLLLCISSFFSVAGQTATLYGMVTDAENGEPILFGNVAVFQDGILVTGVETDFDGNYVINRLEVGVYDVEISYVTHRSLRITNVEILENRNNKLDIELEEKMNIEEIIIISINIPIIEQDNNTQGQIFTSDQLRYRGRGY